MANINKRPVRIAGASVLSGGVNTGELQMTRGGQQIFSAYSGGLLTLGSGSFAPVTNNDTGHAVIFSGPGRLNTVMPLQLISGVQATFYDSNVPALSGVASWTQSGYRVIGVVPANTLGAFGVLGVGPLPIYTGTPFQNGVSVDCASGCAGFTISITQQTVIASGGVEG